MKKTNVVSVPLLSDLRNEIGADEESVIITTGELALRDGKGALYGWNPSSMNAEDSANNVVRPTSIAQAQPGRWEKVFVRKMVLPQGILHINNGIKKLYCAATTDANSEATINLTMENTTNGTAIFSNILWDDSKANINVGNVNDMVSSCRKLLSANMKQLTHIFARGNSAAVSVVGINILGLRTAVAGTNVTFIVEGE